MKNKIITILCVIILICSIFRYYTIREIEIIKSDFKCNMYSTILYDTLRHSKPIPVEAMLFFFMDSIGNNMPRSYTNIIEKSLKNELSSAQIEGEAFYGNLFSSMSSKYSIDVDMIMNKILDDVNKGLPQFNQNDEIIIYDNSIDSYAKKLVTDNNFLLANQNNNIQNHISLMILYSLIINDYFELNSDVIEIMNTKGALMGYESKYLMLVNKVCSCYINKKDESLTKEPLNYFLKEYQIDVHKLHTQIYNYYNMLKIQYYQNIKEMDLRFIRLVIMKFSNRCS